MRACIDCGGPVSAGSKSGLCCVCAPIHRRRPKPRCKVCDKELRTNPKSGLCWEHAMQAMHRDRPRVHVALAAHVSKMRQMTPEARKAYVRPAVEARVRKMLAWCPVEYRDLYRELTNAKRVPATEARALVEQQIECDRKTYLRTGRLPQSERMAA